MEFSDLYFFQNHATGKYLFAESETDISVSSDVSKIDRKKMHWKKVMVEPGIFKLKNV